MRLWAQQEPGIQHQRAQLRLYRLAPTTGKARIEGLGTDMEFPGYDRRHPFRPQALFGVGGAVDPASGLASSIQRVDPRTGAREGYDYGAGVIVEEPIHVPGPDGGHVLHSWLDYRRGQSGLSILRAGQLGEGPVATARMDRVLPLGFHGSFLPRA
jgi:carotenoid cleavage dioxygenase